MKRKLFIAAIASLLLILALRWQGSTLKTSISPRAIIDLELADTPQRVQQLFTVWNIDVTRMNIWIDFLFIAAYVSFLSLASRITAMKWKQNIMRSMGMVLSRIAFLAGILDICENILMLQTTAGNYTPISLSVTFYCAAVKFILAAIIVLYLLVSLPVSIKK